MDHFHQPRSSDKTFNIPLRRLRGKNATQNLLYNPGGPGVSGIAAVYGGGDDLAMMIGEGFHLLSFDPRGVNSSRPTISCDPDNETGIQKSHPPLGHTVDRPEYYGQIQNYVKACADTMQEYGKYINTPQTAADINSILDAVGQQKLVYWGASYGTVLGQTYAALFPERCGRIILDSVADFFEWYETLLPESAYSGMRRVLDGFFDECVKAGHRCSLSSSARSKEELQRKVVSSLVHLGQDPTAVYLNATSYGILDNTTMLAALATGLNSPPAWPQLANKLAQIMDGNATDAFLEYNSIATLADSENTIRCNDGVSGPRYWPEGKKALADVLSPLSQHPILNPFKPDYYVKQQWAIPISHNFVPPRRVKTSHPLLILSNTHDPATPLVGAKVAREVFDGSRLVEVNAYGHGVDQWPELPSKCLMKHVHTYLQDGILPVEDTQCELDRPYFQPKDVNETRR
ncbi:hypothetical protein HIM_10096 [Hirsutella minnesotensis 3608]|uniref:AB hydrolase-1 domain-containing protein n=1 Tax=Hirsutella minnesotensis 3608 TaxID=1043627 RepID=A0A0F7ZKF3_9HYPO|nr:hypothetical protein HIM_10096 [Hirsutella minnesotensis 3608]